MTVMPELRVERRAGVEFLRIGVPFLPFALEVGFRFHGDGIEHVTAFGPVGSARFHGHSSWRVMNGFIVRRTAPAGAA